MIPPAVQRKLYVTALWLTGAWAVFGAVAAWHRVQNYGGTENDLFAGAAIGLIPLLVLVAGRWWWRWLFK